MPRPKSGEAMQMCGVRMGAALLARIDAYGARLKADHPGMRVERGDVIRELVHVGLGVVEARTAETSIDTGEGPSIGHGDAGSGPVDSGGGPVAAPVTLGEAKSANPPPMGEAQTDRKAAPKRTTVRTGHKRTTAAKG